MKKKPQKSHPVKKVLKTKRGYSRYTFIGFAVMALLLIAPITLLSSEKEHVLGITDKNVIELQESSRKKIFGFVPVSFEKRLFVSVQSGEIVKVEQPTLDKILEKISF